MRHTAESSKQRPSLEHPIRKTVKNYMEFYMTPEKHVGYAATWYALSMAPHLGCDAGIKAAKNSADMESPCARPRGRRFGCSIASVVMGVLRFRKKKVGRGFARF